MIAALQAVDLVKRYPGADRNAVDGLTFSVPQGAIVGLLGPNGSGKTTLTKLTCGVTIPTSGEISVFGMAPAANGGRAKHEIGVVHQSGTFDMMLPAMDSLKIAAAFRGVRWKAVWPRAEHLIELLGLTSCMSQLAFTLSGGEQRRLQVVRALMVPTRLLLLDEPSAGLDVAGRRKVWSLITGLREEHGTTVIWTSHYVEELERNCDQVLVINQGRLVEYAAPSVLIERLRTPSLEDAFMQLITES
jgi:ABC-2 type transport system ATP-binding protein